MTNTVKVENKGEGNVSLNDINQTVIINNNNNIKNILDEFNEVALRKGNDFSKFYAKIEDPNSFFYNISRKNLFLKIRSSVKRYLFWRHICPIRY